MNFALMRENRSKENRIARLRTDNSIVCSVLCFHIHSITGVCLVEICQGMCLGFVQTERTELHTHHAMNNR